MSTIEEGNEFFKLFMKVRNSISEKNQSNGYHLETAIKETFKEWQKQQVPVSGLDNKVFELLFDLTCECAMLEDVLHGEEGKRITLIRGLIDKLEKQLQQPNINPQPQVPIPVSADAVDFDFEMLRLKISVEISSDKSGNQKLENILKLVEAYKSQSTIPDAIGDGWIDVKDELPDTKQEVNVYFKNSAGYHVSSSYWNGKNFIELCERCGFNEPFSYSDALVIKWQPLPTPPVYPNKEVVGVKFEDRKND